MEQSQGLNIGAPSSGPKRDIVYKVSSGVVATVTTVAPKLGQVASSALAPVVQAASSMLVIGAQVGLVMGLYKWYQRRRENARVRDIRQRADSQEEYLIAAASGDLTDPEMMAADEAASAFRAGEPTEDRPLLQLPSTPRKRRHWGVAGVMAQAAYQEFPTLRRKDADVLVLKKWLATNAPSFGVRTKDIRAVVERAALCYFVKVDDTIVVEYAHHGREVRELDKLSGAQTRQFEGLGGWLGVGESRPGIQFTKA